MMQHRSQPAQGRARTHTGREGRAWPLLQEEAGLSRQSLGVNRGLIAFLVDFRLHSRQEQRLQSERCNPVPYARQPEKGAESLRPAALARRSPGLASRSAFQVLCNPDY